MTTTQLPMGLNSEMRRALARGKNVNKCFHAQSDPVASAMRLVMRSAHKAALNENKQFDAKRYVETIAESEEVLNAD